VSDVSSVQAGYSGTPLVRKLGIAAGHRVLLAGAPADLALTPLPDGVTIDRSAGPAHRYDVVLACCPDAVALDELWTALHPLTTTAGALWIGWYKRAAKIPTDLDENVVRDYGLRHGRVDVKVCAIDERWSGLKFVVRLTDRITPLTATEG
jgi:hypothetical protein